MNQLEIDVVGSPVAQGSKQGFVRGGRVVIVDMSKQLPKWRAAVTKAVEARMRLEHWVTVDGPVEVRVTLVFERPKSVTREFPTVAPDADKCARAILDSLTDAHAFKDDSRVVDLIVRKRYAQPGGNTGARILIINLAQQTLAVG